MAAVLVDENDEEADEDEEDPDSERCDATKVDDSVKGEAVAEEAKSCRCGSECSNGSLHSSRRCTGNAPLLLLPVVGEDENDEEETAALLH